MTASYHERSNAAPAHGKWRSGFVVIGCALALGGCSVSMPMAGLMEPASSPGVASRASNDASADPAAEKPAIELAAARPDP